MCNGPEDTPQNIKACLRQAPDYLLAGMKVDWNVYHTANSKKMQRCINEIINERKEKQNDKRKN